MQSELSIIVERVNKFCYLGKMLGEEGGANLAVTNRVSKAWENFITMVPLLCNKSVSER